MTTLRPVDVTDDDRLDLAACVRHVVQHAVVVLALALVGAGAGVTVAHVLPPSYSAESTLFVRAESSGSSLYERSEFALQQVSSYAQLGTSAEVLAPVAESLGISTGELADRVSVTNPVDTVVLHVTATSPTAQGAADLADTVAGRLTDAVDRIEGSGDGRSVTLDATVPAPVPTASSGPSTAVLGLLGLLVGLGLGIAAALALGATRPRVSTIEEVRRATGLPVVGQLPTDLARAHDARRRSTGAAAALRETVQNVRTLRGGDLPSLLVVARTEGVDEADGVAAGLARAVVELDASCALVEGDADVRSTRWRASASAPASAERDPAGLDRVPVVDVVRAAALGRSRAVASRSFPGLRSEHDVTVVSASSESEPLPLRTVAAEADEVVLVVRAGRTRLDALRGLVAELTAADVEAVGVVLTGVPRRRRVLLRATWRDHDVTRTPSRASASPGPVGAPATGPTRLPSADDTAAGGAGELASRGESDAVTSLTGSTRSAVRGRARTSRARLAGHESSGPAS